jgi:hypothetical protein
MDREEPGTVALRALDEVLAQKPRKDDHRLSLAAQCLCAFRNHVIEQHRQAGASRVTREHLLRLNAVLSVVLGCHFPLGDVPWHELERARSWLHDLVADPP